MNVVQVLKEMEAEKKVAKEPAAVGNESLVAEIDAAKLDWQQAWENFHHADKNFVDAAIWWLKAATEKYDALVRLAKGRH